MKFINKNLKSLIFGAIAAAIGMTSAADNTAAQGIFSGFWGASDRPISRTTVSLKVPYRTGTIIVSTGDSVFTQSN